MLEHTGGADRRQDGNRERYKREAIDKDIPVNEMELTPALAAEPMDTDLVGFVAEGIRAGDPPQRIPVCHRVRTMVSPKGADYKHYYEVVGYPHRLAAAIVTGLDPVPCTVLSEDDHMRPVGELVARYAAGAEEREEATAP